MDFCREYKIIKIYLARNNVKCKQIYLCSIETNREIFVMMCAKCQSKHLILKYWHVLSIFALLFLRHACAHRLTNIHIPGQSHYIISNIICGLTHKQVHSVYTIHQNDQECKYDRKLCVFVNVYKVAFRFVFMRILIWCAQINHFVHKAIATYSSIAQWNDTNKINGKNISNFMRQTSNH